MSAADSSIFLLHSSGAGRLTPPTVSVENTISYIIHDLPQKSGIKQSSILHTSRQNLTSTVVLNVASCSSFAAAIFKRVTAHNTSNYIPLLITMQHEPKSVSLTLTFDPHPTFNIALSLNPQPLRLRPRLSNGLPCWLNSSRLGA